MRADLALSRAIEIGFEMSISGQIVKEASSLGGDNYSYDKAGRLTSAQETPQGGSCTTRAYAYDVDSNRTSMTTRSPGIGGVCSNSGGTTQPYEYDPVDRLMGSGITYDIKSCIRQHCSKHSASMKHTTFEHCRGESADG
jgi:YD repeat-containing protein